MKSFWAALELQFGGVAGCNKVLENRPKSFAIPLALALGLGILCAPKARAQVFSDTTTNSANVSVNFVTTTATPLNPGFNGFNGNMLNAVEYYDTNFQLNVAALSPGWLRFPGGTDSEAFNWATGEIVPAWIDALAAKRLQGHSAIRPGLCPLCVDEPHPGGSLGTRQ